MAEGANVGSIVGYLRLDRSDWDATINGAKAKADELKASNPNIRVTASTGSALAQLEAVAAATKRLQDANDRVSVSQAKLTDLENAEGTSATKLLSAKAALAKATRDQELAQIKLASAYTQTDTAAKRVGESAEGAGLSVGKLLLPALAGVATVIAPLGAVGAAAFGTLLLGSQQLKSQVTSQLSPAFADLEKTATQALTPGIEGAVNQLQQALPKLDPLITDFGHGIGTAADQLATWLNNGGIKGFVSYAEKELPIVESAFKSVAEVGIDTFKALTTPANILLKTLGDTATAIDVIEKKLAQFSGGPTGTGTPGTPGAGGPPSSVAGQAGYALGGNSYAPKPKSTSDYFLGIPHDIATIFSSGGSPTGNPSGQRTPKPKVAAPPAPTPPATVAQQEAAYASGGLIVQQGAAIVAAQQKTAGAYATLQAGVAAANAAEAQNVAEMAASNNAAGILSDALNQLGNNQLGVAQTSVGWHEALSRVNDGLKQNGASLNITTEAGQSNLDNLNALVSAAQQNALAIAQQTGSSQQATTAYNASITAIEGSIGATGKNKTAILNYLATIDKIPALKPTTVDLEDAAALAKIANLKAELFAIPNVAIGVQASALVYAQSQGVDVSHRAAGGLITGPGSGTSDSIPIMASNREYVLQSAAVARLGVPFLNALNAGVAGPAIGSPAASSVRASYNADGGALLAEVRAQTAVMQGLITAISSQSIVLSVDAAGRQRLAQLIRNQNLADDRR